jgi:hypothetical protein
MTDIRAMASGRILTILIPFIDSAELTLPQVFDHSNGGEMVGGAVVYPHRRSLR